MRHALNANWVDEKLREFIDRSIASFAAEYPPLVPLRIALVASWLSPATSAEDVALFAHLAPLPSAEKLKDGVSVETSNLVRTATQLKLTAWVQDRQTAPKRYATSNDVLIVDEDQKIYEGHTSNFFVLLKRNGRTVLQTASQSLVLPGTILKMVLETCNAFDIPVVFECPSLTQRSEWEGAYITSTSRAVAPVNEIILSDDSRFHLSSNTHPTYLEISKSIQERIEA